MSERLCPSVLRDSGGGGGGSQGDPNGVAQECYVFLVGSHVHVIPRLWAARVVLVGNNMQIASIILKVEVF